MAKMLPEAKNAKGNWQCRENIWVGPFVFGSFFWLLRRHQCFSHPGGEGGHSALCGWRSCLVLRRRIGPKGGHPVNFRRPPAFFWPTRPIPSFLFFFLRLPRTRRTLFDGHVCGACRPKPANKFLAIPKEFPFLPSLPVPNDRCPNGLSPPPPFFLSFRAQRGHGTKPPSPVRPNPRFVQPLLILLRKAVQKGPAENLSFLPPDCQLPPPWPHPFLPPKYWSRAPKNAPPPPRERNEVWPCGKMA